MSREVGRALHDFHSFGRCYGTARFKNRIEWFVIYTDFLFKKITRHAVAGQGGAMAALIKARAENSQNDRLSMFNPRGTRETTSPLTVWGGCILSFRLLTIIYYAGRSEK